MTIAYSGDSITFPDNSVQNTAATGFGFKNRIINGAMVIDQRNAGASQTVITTGAYTVDRFFVQPTGASVTTQRVAGPSGYQYAFRLTGAASVTQCFVQQKIEQLNSNDLAGQTITVSFTASSSTLTSLTCYVEYATAGADNWGTFTTSTTQAITINSTATRYSFQATLSASATNGIRFIFSTGAFTSGTMDITGVQLEKGSTATSFDYRPYGTELALCQRYCFATRPSTSYGRYGIGASETTSNLGVIIYPPVTMRIPPASLTTASAASYAVYQGSVGFACTSVTLGANSEVNALLVNFNTSASQTAGYSGHGLSNNNLTSYLIFNAEL